MVCWSIDFSAENWVVCGVGCGISFEVQVVIMQTMGLRSRTRALLHAVSSLMPTGSLWGFDGVSSPVSVICIYSFALIAFGGERILRSGVVAFCFCNGNPLLRCRGFCRISCLLFG